MVVGDLSLCHNLYIFDTTSIKMNVKLPCRQAKQCFDLCQNFDFSMARIVYKLAHAHLKWFNPKWNQRINNETKRGREALILPKLQKLAKFPLLEVPNVTVSNSRWISTKFSVQGEIIYLHAENVEHEKLQNGARVAWRDVANEEEMRK